MQFTGVKLVAQTGRVILQFALCLLVMSSLSCKPQVSTSSPQQSAPPVEPALPPSSTAPQPVRWAADGILGAGEYAKARTYGNFEIVWSSDDNHIYIGMKAKTTGWVALGIQPGFMMKDADMVLGFVKDGRAMVTDEFGTGAYGPHRPDTELGGSNDITEYGGREENGYTIIEFKRALNTGDRYDHQLVRGLNKIIWAFGGIDEFTLKHTQRGYGEIDL